MILLYILGICILGICLWMDYKQDKVDTNPIYIPYIGELKFHRTILSIFVFVFIVWAR